MGRYIARRCLQAVLTLFLVFKGGPVEDVMVGVCVFCCIVLVATNRKGWKHMTPFRWVLLTAILGTTLVDYVVATPVTHTAQRTVYWVCIVWLIAKRVDFRSYWRDWREVMTAGND